MIEKNRNENYSNLYFNIENYVNKTSFLFSKETEKRKCANCLLGSGSGYGKGVEKMEDESNGTSSNKNHQ
jgi:hypothetical protein